MAWGKTNASPWSRPTPNQGYDPTGRRLALGHAYASGVVTPNALTMGPTVAYHPPIPPVC